MNRYDVWLRDQLEERLKDTRMFKACPKAVKIATELYWIPSVRGTRTLNRIYTQKEILALLKKREKILPFFGEKRGATKALARRVQKALDRVKYGPRFDRAWSDQLFARKSAKPPYRQTLRERLDTHRVVEAKCCLRASGIKLYPAQGGDIEITLDDDPTKANWITQRDTIYPYSGRKNYPALQVTHKITLPRDWRVSVQRAGLALPAPKTFTLSAQKIAERGEKTVFLCRIARQNGNKFGPRVGLALITRHKDGKKTTKTLAQIMGEKK